MAHGSGHPAVVRVVVIVVAFLVVVFLLAATFVSAAGAAQLEQPAFASPYRVKVDAGSHPVPFTVVASGFTPAQQVFVEQCDDVSPSTPNWDPTIDCDSGSSPAPVIAGSDGRATFAADNPNHRFTPFVGRSPQDQFTCATTCQVRVSSNNAAITSDQVLFSIALPAGATPPPASGRVTTSVSAPPTTSAPGATTTTSTKKGSGVTTTSRPKARGSTTTVAAAPASAGGHGASGSGNGSSATSVGRLIGGLVIAAGVGGYLWAWRRKRLTAAS